MPLPLRHLALGFQLCPVGPDSAGLAERAMRLATQLKPPSQELRVPLV